MVGNKQQQREKLEKTMSPLSVWALALGAIIGWGCFVLPGIRFLPDSGPLAGIIGFFLGAALLCTVALCYSILIKAYPVAGGSFTYAYIGFGVTSGFICGWALVLGYLCVIAANGTAIALLTRFVLPGVFNVGYLYSIAGWDIYAGEMAVISAAFILIAYMNFRGMDFAATLQVYLALALLAGVVILGVGAVSYDDPLIGKSSLENLKPFFASDRTPFAAVIAILAVTPWLFVGFDTIPQTAEEFDFPPKKSRMLMISSILCGAVIYSIVLLAVAFVIPYPELLKGNHPWATGYIASLIFGRWGGAVLAVPVLAAIFTGMNGFFMATTRLLFSMGRAEFLPSFFSKVHSEFNTPVNAIVFTLCLTIIAPWFGRSALNWIVDMSAMGTALAYLYSCMTAYKYIDRHPEVPEASWGKSVAVVGIATSVVCFFLLAIPGSPAAIVYESWVALFIWIGIGGCFYFSRIFILKKIPVHTMKYMILGKTDRPLLFCSEEEEK